MEDASRVFWLKRFGERLANHETMFVPSSDPTAASRAPGELFFEFYEPIRDWMQKRSKPGLAVLALDGDGIQAKAYLRASRQGVNSAIAGRYDKAEILLRGDQSLSLRHLAVLVEPFERGRPLRFRVVDLRTAIGFQNEDGRIMRACEASDPIFARCGPYTLLFAPATPSDPPWPKEPEEMWKKVRHPSEPSKILPRPKTLDDVLLSEGEEAIGELVISSHEGNGCMPVGRRAAKNGILLGRSDRCDGDVLLSDPHISRVHVLVVELGGSLYAVDTASKNGMWGLRGARRAQLLESGTRISLCGLATVEWRFYH